MADRQSAEASTRKLLWVAWNVVYLGGALASIVATVLHDRRSPADADFFRWHQWVVVFLALGFFANKAIRKAVFPDEPDSDESN